MTGPFTSLESLRSHAIPGRVAIVTGDGGLPKVVVTTEAATAEVYLHGAHVTSFRKHDEAPLLFMSRKSRFEPGQPIRGGVPICFPWFGARAGAPSHGLARLTAWQLLRTTAASDGAVSLSFSLPTVPGLDAWAPLATTFTLRVSAALDLTLETTHRGEGDVLPIEPCLHTYFQVGDIDGVTLVGLDGAPFDDFAFGASGARRAGAAGGLRIAQETNRVYPDSEAPVQIRDDRLGRVVRVEKTGSRSTVVWNPWTTQAMPDDFDQTEYRQMVCVESGNVKQNAIALGPGHSAVLSVSISSDGL